MIFDRIELGTYMIAGALLAKNLMIDKIDPKIIKSEIKYFKKNRSQNKKKKFNYY